MTDSVVGTGFSASYAALFFKMVGASVVVIVLAILALKYLLPYLTQARKNKKSAIQILDYQALEPKKSVYILQIEDKRMAICVSEQSVCKLCDL